MAPELRAAGAAHNQILMSLAGVFDARPDSTEQTKRVELRALLRSLTDHMSGLEELDIELRLAVDEVDELTFVTVEARLTEMLRAAVAMTERLVQAAKSLKEPASTYEAAEAAAREWRRALDWTPEDYFKSEKFNEMLDEAVANAESGNTVEGGFGE